MAKKSVIYREIKRQKIVNKFFAKRQEIKAKIGNRNVSFEDKIKLSFELQKLPRDSSPVRLVSRCSMTGRAHAVYRDFGICRNKLREKAMLGEVPGLLKSSW